MLDQLLFQEHLLLPEYIQGEILGYWGKVDENIEHGAKWPHSLFWISVEPKGLQRVSKFFMRLELTNYNVIAPAGCFWDVAKNMRLDNSLWPKVTGPFERGFRTDWPQQGELYAPWDRGGLNAHAEWGVNNKAVSWKSGISKIHDYLHIIYEILNSANYHGTNSD